MSNTHIFIVYLQQAIHGELQRIVTPSGHSRQYDQMSLDIRWSIWDRAALSHPPTPPCGLSALAGITSIEQLLKTEFAMTPPGSSKRKRSKLRPGDLSRDFNGSNVPLPLLPAASAGPCSTPRAAAHCFLLRFTQQLPLPELQQQQAAVGEVIMFQPALDCHPKEFQDQQAREVVAAAAAGADAGRPLLHPLCVNQDHNWMFQSKRQLWVNDSVMYGVVEVLQDGMLCARQRAAAARRRWAQMPRCCCSKNYNNGMLRNQQASPPEQQLKAFNHLSKDVRGIKCSLHRTQGQL
jgi:hypothetical protein